MVQDKAKRIITNFTDILKSPEMQILPGQIAFYFVMSIIPIATISGVVASLIIENFNFVDTVNSVLPKALATIFTSLSTDLHIQGIAFVLVLYLLLGSNAPGSIIIASNIFYEVEQPNSIKLKFKSFVMTVIIVVLLLFVVIFPLLGDIIVNFITTTFNSNFLDNYRLLYVTIKGLGSFIVMFFIIKLLYTYAPSKRIDRTTTIKGSLFTSVGWILSTYIFAFYITNIASYDVVYGNFANILILLLWVYILAYLFVVGMALNVDDFHKQRKCLNEKDTKRKAKKEESTKIKQERSKQKNKK